MIRASTHTQVNGRKLFCWNASIRSGATVQRDRAGKMDILVDGCAGSQRDFRLRLETKKICVIFPLKSCENFPLKNLRNFPLNRDFFIRKIFFLENTTTRNFKLSDNSIQFGQFRHNSSAIHFPSRSYQTRKSATHNAIF